MSTRLDRLSGQVARWLVQQPRQVALTLAVIVVGSLAALTTLRLESGTRVFVADDEPAQRFLKEVETQFVSDDVVLVAADADDPFSHASLEETRALGAQFLGIRSEAGAGLVGDVLSLATVSDLQGGDGTFRSQPLVPEPVPTNAEALQDIATRARHNGLIRDGLLSASSPRISVMLVRLNRGLEDPDRARVVSEVRTILDQPHAAGTRYFVTGAPVVESDSITCMLVDLKRFIPVTYLLLSALIFFLTRRVAGVALAFVNATIAVLFGMGALAIFGSLTTLSTIMPPLLMVLSVATVVHFLTEYARLAQQLPRERAAEVALKELLVPAFMCELTTAVGFVSFAFNRIPALREFGVAAAVAVMGTFVTSFLCLALAVRVMGPEQLISTGATAASARLTRWVDTYTDLAIRKPKHVLALMGVLTALSALGLVWFKVDHSTVDQFTGDLPVRRATDLVNTHLGGSNELIVSVRTRDENRFLDPAELHKLEALQQFLVSDSKATTTISVADHVKLMHRAWNEDRDAALRVPDTREQTAQLVLLNGDDRLFQFVDRAWKWARISARTTESGSAMLGERFARIDDYLKVHFPASAGYDTQLTGATHLDVVMATSILDGQTTSFLFSLALIFIPIILLFGSVVAGLFTLPSNLFPVLACMGVMGWLGIPLDVATSMVASIVLGIAVDDTIHFVQGMRHGLAEHQDLERAVKDTMATKGVGALWITLIITVGFGALTASTYKPTFNFGLMTAFAMIAGVAAEVLLLPPLIILTGTRLGVPRAVVPPAVQGEAIGEVSRASA